MRDRIRDKLIEHRFGEERDALIAEATALGPRVYDALMGEHKATALTLPSSLVARGRVVRVDLPGVEGSFVHEWPEDRPTLRIAGTSLSSCTFVLPEELPMPRYNDWPYRLEKEGELFTKIEDVNLRAALHRKARVEMTEKLTATLGAFTTVNKLVEAWPEVLPFCPSTSEFAAPFLPAVPTDELNKALNLKPKEQEDDE